MGKFKNGKVLYWDVISLGHLILPLFHILLLFLCNSVCFYSTSSAWQGVKDPAVNFLWLSLSLSLPSPSLLSHSITIVTTVTFYSSAWPGVQDPAVNFLWLSLSLSLLSPSLLSHSITILTTVTFYSSAWAGVQDPAVHLLRPSGGRLWPHRQVQGGGALLTRDCW